MEFFQNSYPVFKAVGHLSVVSFDLALVLVYHRLTGNICISELKMWVYGQFILHAWLALVAFIHLFVDRNPVYPGRIVLLVLKGWWVLYAIFLFYQCNACMVLAPLLYWWVGCGGVILSVSLFFEWKPPIQTDYELSEIPPPVLREISFGQNSPGKCESPEADGLQPVCPICLEPFNQDETISVLSCNHLYHPACIYEWLRKKLCCPVCRTAIEPVAEG